MRSTTAYFRAVRGRPDRAAIRDEWIDRVVTTPEREERQLDGRIRLWKVTDTLYIEFRAADAAETRDLDENTQVDLDAAGRVCALTLEHATERADLPRFSFEQVYVSEFARSCVLRSCVLRLPFPKHSVVSITASTHWRSQPSLSLYSIHWPSLRWVFNFLTPPWWGFSCSIPL